MGEDIFLLEQTIRGRRYFADYRMLFIVSQYSYIRGQHLLFDILWQITILFFECRREMLRILVTR